VTTGQWCQFKEIGWLLEWCRLTTDVHGGGGAHNNIPRRYN